MAFWIFMLIMDLMIPGIMIGFGRSFLKGAPDNMHSFYGYRTKRSRKSRETWEFAHAYCGKLWYRWGWITMVISILVMLSVLGKNIDIVGTVAGNLCGIQCIPILVPIWMTERALKREFDEEGHRKW